MSRPRFLADNDVNAAIVDGLRRSEPALSVVSVRDVGMDNRPDDEVLDFAARQGLVVLSHDVSTMSASAYDRIVKKLPMTGLVLATQSMPVRTVIEQVVIIWACSEANEWIDRVEFLPL